MDALIDTLPRELREFLSGAGLTDCSCSQEAAVVFADKDGGYFLKSAAKGALARENLMTRYMHEKGLAAKVIAYVSEERDYLLTERVPGRDCTAPEHLAQPERLCDMLAECLVVLHGEDTAGCPVPNETELYLKAAELNMRLERYNKNHFPDSFGYATAEEAWNVVEAKGHLLKTDTLLHGDYCLPNVMLDGWQFSGFIDLDSGGVGDRHVDIFWALWSLEFNLKTDRYRQRFIDAYGRDRVDEEMLRIVAAVEVFDARA
jgi:kanamycin kinase